MRKEEKKRRKEVLSRYCFSRFFCAVAILVTKMEMSSLFSSMSGLHLSSGSTSGLRWVMRSHTSVSLSSSFITPCSIFDIQSGGNVLANRIVYRVVTLIISSDRKLAWLEGVILPGQPHVFNWPGPCFYGACWRLRRDVVVHECSNYPDSDSK